MLLDLLADEPPDELPEEPLDEPPEELEPEVDDEPPESLAAFLSVPPLSLVPPLSPEELEDPELRESVR